MFHQRCNFASLRDALLLLVEARLPDWGERDIQETSVLEIFDAFPRQSVCVCLVDPRRAPAHTNVPVPQPFPALLVAEALDGRDELPEALIGLDWEGERVPVLVRGGREVEGGGPGQNLLKRDRVFLHANEAQHQYEGVPWVQFLQVVVKLVFFPLRSKWNPLERIPLHAYGPGVAKVLYFAIHDHGNAIPVLVRDHPKRFDALPDDVRADHLHEIWKNPKNKYQYEFAGLQTSIGVSLLDYRFRRGFLPTPPPSADPALPTLSPSKEDPCPCAPGSP